MHSGRLVKARVGLRNDLDNDSETSTLKALKEDLREGLSFLPGPSETVASWRGFPLTHSLVHSVLPLRLGPLLVTVPLICSSLLPAQLTILCFLGLPVRFPCFLIGSMDLQVNAGSPLLISFL